MSIREHIQQVLLQSQRTQDKRQVAVIRQITAAIKQFEVNNKTAGVVTAASEAQIIEILAKLVKQRNESITEFSKANRQDLINQEEYELAIIQLFLPQPLSDSEIQQLIAEAITATNATTPKDMGKVIEVLRPKLTGRADMAKVSATIKTALAQ